MNRSAQRGLHRRARANLAARRRHQDQLVRAAIKALAASEAAHNAIQAAQHALEQAVTELDALGVPPRDLAVIVGVDPSELHSQGGTDKPMPALASPADDPGAPEASDGEAVRLWLAMIERGPSPKTHAVDRDGLLLCRGKIDVEHLATWIGYPFDVDCRRCEKVLAGELTAEQLG